jgi:hypothetical protein
MANTPRRRTPAVRYPAFGALGLSALWLTGATLAGTALPAWALAAAAGVILALAGVWWLLLNLSHGGRFNGNHQAPPHR